MLFFSFKVFAEEKRDVILSKKVDKIKIYQVKGQGLFFSLYVGSWKVNYTAKTKAVVVQDDRDGFIVYFKKSGEKCHPFYIIPVEIFSDLSKLVEYSYSSQRDLHGFCAEENGNKFLPKKDNDSLKKI